MEPGIEVASWTTRYHAKKTLGLLYTYNVIFLMVWLSEINITILAKSILFCRFCYMFVTEWISEENAKDACKRD